MNDIKREDINDFEPIINRVEQSGLITINLEDLLPQQEILELDLKDFLFQGLLLREKEFRSTVKEFDWSTYTDKLVAIHCSTDALIQQWAYMLITTKLLPAKSIYFGTKSEVKEMLHLQNIRDFNIEELHGKKVIVKGCGREQVSDAAYLEISKKLLPVVQSMMFGEACSTVPIYKQAK